MIKNWKNIFRQSEEENKQDPSWETKNRQGTNEGFQIDVGGGIRLFMKGIDSVKPVVME